MALRVDAETVDGRVVAVCRGAIDMSTLPTLHGALGRVVTEAAGSVVTVDLDEVDSLDDAGLGVLLGAAGRARRSDGDLVVVCSDPDRRARLAVTGFDRAVPRPVSTRRPLTPAPSIWSPTFSISRTWVTRSPL